MSSSTISPVFTQPAPRGTVPFWRQLLNAVSRGQLRPSTASTDDVAGSPRAVRALADRYRRSSPGFANDLFAAADRHEMIHCTRARTETR